MLKWGAAADLLIVEIEEVGVGQEPGWAAHLNSPGAYQALVNVKAKLRVALDAPSTPDVPPDTAPTLAAGALEGRANAVTMGLQNDRTNPATNHNQNGAGWLYTKEWTEEELLKATETFSRVRDCLEPPGSMGA